MIHCGFALFQYFQGEGAERDRHD